MDSVTLFDGTDVLAPMTESEARACADSIKAGIFNVGRQLLDLYERDGWRVLGYANWRECAQIEFGYKQSHVYRLLEAAQVERNISPIGETVIPESHARPLVALPPEEQRTVYQQAIETAPNGKMTAAHVERTIERLHNPEQPTDLPPALAIPLKPHVANNSGNNEWYTPREYIATAHEVMGAIDLDPASTAKANEVVGAAQFYTAEQDGLTQAWVGRVWMNPPYASDLIWRFVDKLAVEYSAGNVTEAIVLVNNATETAWFGGIINFASAIVFPRQRVRFWQPDGTQGAPLQGQAVIYLGDKPDMFLDLFSAFGWAARIWQ